MLYGNKNGFFPPLFPLQLHLGLILAWKSKSDMGKLHLEVQLLNQNQNTCSENAVHISQCIPMCILYTVLEGCSGGVLVWQEWLMCAATDQQVNFYYSWRVMERDLDPNETTTAHILLCSGQFFSICFYHYRCYFLLGLRELKYYLSDKSKPHVCLCSWDIWAKWLGLSACDNDSSWDIVVARPRSQGADRNKLSPPGEHDLYTTPFFQSRL